MTNRDDPMDRDLAARLEPGMPISSKTTSATAPLADAPTSLQESVPPAQNTVRQTIHDVLIAGEEPTDEFMEEFHVMESAAPLSDEELEQQALEHPGEDGDPQTPE
jgi:hypothetical protein